MEKDIDTTKTGTKVIWLRKVRQLKTILLPQPPIQLLKEVILAPIDIFRLNEDNPQPESQIFKSVALIQKQIRNIDGSSSFFGNAVVYINGIGQLKKQILSFQDADANVRANNQYEWFLKIILPPDDVQFSSVKSAGMYTLALSVTGQLWSRGIKPNGTIEESDRFAVNPHFQAKDGLIPSSIGASNIISYAWEGHRAIIILQNGAVFAYGQLQELQSYDNKIPVEGIIELTDSKRFSPKFSDKLRGQISNDVGQFGIFGTHKVIKYIRKMNAFLTEGGLVISRYYINTPGKVQLLYTPLDPQWFGGETVVKMYHIAKEAYVLQSGRFIVTEGNKEEEALGNDIKQPYATGNLPFSLNELQSIIMISEPYITFLRKNGQLISVQMLYADDKLPEIIDVTSLPAELAREKDEDQEMTIKKIGRCSYFCYILYE
ncbi:MAG: hypothetical protein EZS28_003978 [Streblomastix strix]|uniref:Uncharacterized protein n=1 Tax=Streblomastix strix TaxID=222440 RepID=A0A5J4WZS6_9EUKA|nr:MAG: hypothetical protein EZS28_003978 [Streblomastix strix]